MSATTGKTTGATAIRPFTVSVTSETERVPVTAVDGGNEPVDDGV
jgi:hypothetical protein